MKLLLCAGYFTGKTFTFLYASPFLPCSHVWRVMDSLKDLEKYHSSDKDPCPSKWTKRNVNTVMIEGRNNGK